MSEYHFEVSGREDLLVPTGTGESGLYCYCRHYQDNRVKEIESIVEESGGTITHRGVFFTPTAGKVRTMDLDVSLTSKQLDSFNLELLQKGYDSKCRELGIQEVQKRNEDMKRAGDALKRAALCHDSLPW